MTNVLVLCTANACRSVMAEALLITHLTEQGGTASVTSAGTLAYGGLPPSAVVTLMANRGIDISRHRGRRVATGDLAAADLVLTMTRDHVRHAVVLRPEAWPRSFTLPELVRRGLRAGPRDPGEPLADWLARAAAERTRRDLLGGGTTDDIADPTGGPARGYRVTAQLLDDLTAELADLAFGCARKPGRAQQRPGRAEA